MTRFSRQFLILILLLILGLLIAIGGLVVMLSGSRQQGLDSGLSQVLGASQSQQQVSQSFEENDEDTEIPQYMSDITYSFVMNNQAATSEASTTRIVIAGKKFFRREAPPRLDRGKREIIIKNRKDNWIINLFNRDAIHYESAAQPKPVRVPVYFGGISLKGDLLVGEEVKFFSENNAQKTIEGTEVVYELTIPDGKVRLAVDVATDKPVKIDVINDSSPFSSYSVKYGTFERKLPFNPQLFQVPSGVMTRESEPKGGNQEQYAAWSSEDPALLNYYLKPDPQSLIKVFENLPSTGIPEIRQPFIELAAAILTIEPTLITSFVRVAKQSNPELQIWAALSLRSCKTQDCLNVLKTNPFGFVDEGFRGFMGGNELVDRSGRNLVYRISINSYMAEFLVTGTKESLGNLLNSIDSQAQMGVDGKLDLSKLEAISLVSPGVIDLIKKIAISDPSVETYLLSKKDAKSKAATEILRRLHGEKGWF